MSESEKPAQPGANPPKSSDLAKSSDPASKPETLPPEIGGAPGPDPTRYGDWQHKGRVTDF
jgi:hypothetical protein